MGYCIYTGASAILEDAKNGKGTANTTLRTFLRALNTGMRRCPLLERSINIIVKSLNRPATGALHPQNGSSGFQNGGGRHNPSHEVDMTSVPTNGYIPAFPYLGSSADMNFDVDDFFSGGEVGSMAMLDCFPEMQMDMGELIMPPLT